jgi:hypothetical protein
MMVQLEDGQRFGTIVGLGKHLHIRLAVDKHLHALPLHGVIVHQHQSRFRCFHD